MEAKQSWPHTHPFERNDDQKLTEEWELRWKF